MRKRHDSKFKGWRRRIGTVERGRARLSVPL